MFYVQRQRATAVLAALLLASLGAAPAAAERADDATPQATTHDTAALAKQAQNPIANLISLPFQNNTTFDNGTPGEASNILNIQPVWPFQLGEHVNLITRTILPVDSQPGGTTKKPDGTFYEDRQSGLGDMTFTGFFSPAKAATVTWGLGPVFLFPTATDDRLGKDKWGLGPSFVVLTMPGNWVIGTLVSNVWSVGGSGDQDVNFFTWQYFVNYNLSNGWYLTSSPIMTANWEESSGNKWTVPVGAGVGKIFRIGKQPFNTSAQVFYNVEKPQNVGDWAMRLQVQLMFPK
jgi:hypothetical protein